MTLRRARIRVRDGRGNAAVAGRGATPTAPPKPIKPADAASEMIPSLLSVPDLPAASGKRNHWEISHEDSNFTIPNPASDCGQKWSAATAEQTASCDLELFAGQSDGLVASEQVLLRRPSPSRRGGERAESQRMMAGVDQPCKDVVVPTTERLPAAWIVRRDVVCENVAGHKAQLTVAPRLDVPDQCPASRSEGGDEESADVAVDPKGHLSDGQESAPLRISSAIGIINGCAMLDIALTAGPRKTFLARIEQAWPNSYIDPKTVEELGMTRRPCTIRLRRPAKVPGYGEVQVEFFAVFRAMSMSGVDVTINVGVLEGLYPRGLVVSPKVLVKLGWLVREGTDPNSVSEPTKQGDNNSTALAVDL